MGQVPVGRLSIATRPFTYTGIDFFGPFLTTVGRRKEKRYGVLFTCLTCRAVHIELAFSLATSSCIIAIRNFMGRRGIPLQFYSDNGTNFIGAERELREEHRKLVIEDLKENFTTSETKWIFIPPASPHMGGAWERMIRSAKNILYKIVTPLTSLNDEKLYNLFIEVESMLNSRPLTQVPLESADQEALTPNHILLGTSNGSKPPEIFNERYITSSWKHSQYLADCFWKRWVTEVLPILTRRTKWHDKVKPVECGDVVLIVDPNLPRSTWIKGIVTSAVCAKDGQVRSVFVRTANGEYHRPVAKIAVLDVRAKTSDGVAIGGIDERIHHTEEENVGNTHHNLI